MLASTEQKAHAADFRQSFIFNGLLFVVLAVFWSMLIEGTNSDLTPDNLRLIRAVSSVICGFMLLPAVIVSSKPHWLALAWPLLVTAGAFALMMAGTGEPAAVRAAGQLSIGVFSLTALLASAFCLFHTFGISVVASILTITMAIGLAGTSPLWMGPLAELFAPSHAAATAIVSISPVSYLAALADFDYLRSTWLYQHAPFGGLQFNYPDVALMTGAYLVMTVGALMLCMHRRRLNSPARILITDNA